MSSKSIRTINQVAKFVYFAFKLRRGESMQKKYFNVVIIFRSL